MRVNYNCIKCMVYELHDAISQSAIHFVSENDVFLIETLVGNVGISSV